MFFLFLYFLLLPKFTSGYFWITKVFVANTLRPDAMDDSRVLIAVITPITEKTPILIPKRVRLERSLFFRIASIANQKLSVTIFFIFLETISFVS